MGTPLFPTHTHPTPDPIPTLPHTLTILNPNPKIHPTHPNPQNQPCARSAQCAAAGRPTLGRRARRLTALRACRAGMAMFAPAGGGQEGKLNEEEEKKAFLAASLANMTAEEQSEYNSIVASGPRAGWWT